jgi:hypothetical protein
MVTFKGLLKVPWFGINETDLAFMFDETDLAFMFDARMVGGKLNRLMRIRLEMMF